MTRFRRKRKNINFLLLDKHYKKLHLLLYFFTLFVILTIYFILVLIFHDKSIRTVVFVFCTFVLGIFLVFKRDEIVLEFSDWHEDYKRKKLKESDREGLKTTIRKVVPRNRNLKLDIKGKVPLKDRLNKIRNKVKKDPEKKMPDYIEIKD